MQPETAPLAGPKQWLGLVILVLPSLLLFMMLTVLFLAAPFISADLAPSPSEMLWILDIYGFVMAGLLVAMGVMADRYGARNLLMIGAAAFALASIGAAYSPNAGTMIAWRALLGVAAAMQMPATLGLIFATFHDPRQRGVAIGVWAASISAGVAIGPLVSGLLLEAFGWQATFLIAAPVMALVVIGAPLLLPGGLNPAGGRLDILSVGMLLLSLFPIIYGIKQLSAESGPVVGLASIAVGLVVGTMFVVRQLRSTSPLLDVRLFANGRVSAALAVFVLSAAALGGFYFMFAQHLQLVAGLTPLNAGLAILPGALLLVLVAMTSPIIARRVSPGLVIAFGLLVQVVGYGLFAFVDATTAVPVLILSFMVLYPAVAPSMALTTDLVVGSVPPERAAAASGLATTANDLGISLGIAVVGAFGLAAYRGALPAEVLSGVSPEAASQAASGLAGAISAAETMTGEAGAVLATAARDAFASGLNLVAMVAAAIALLAAAISLFRLRRPA